MIFQELAGRLVWGSSISINRSSISISEPSYIYIYIHPEVTSSHCYWLLLPSSSSFCLVVGETSFLFSFYLSEAGKVIWSCSFTETVRVFLGRLVGEVLRWWKSWPWGLLIRGRKCDPGRRRRLITDTKLLFCLLRIYICTLIIVI